MDAKEELVKFGKRIKELRLAKSMTQLELAEGIEQNLEYIAEIEAGTCNLFITEIGGLARKLETPITQLFQ